MKLTTFAFVIGLFAFFAADGFAADGKTYAEKCEARYGQQPGETSSQYENRIQKARLTLRVAQPYIDSNMLWEDSTDYERGNH